MVRDVQTGNHNQVTEAVKSLRSTPVGCNLFKSFVRMEGIFNLDGFKSVSKHHRC